MTIIGKPPTPHTGCTFADRDPGHLFVLRGENYLKESATTARLLCRGARSETIAGDTQVLPVLMTPAEPKLDPAVTTYADAVGHFEWLSGEPHHGGGGICFASDTAYIDADGDTWLSDPEWDSCPVRILSPLEVAEHFATLAGAHVVVPEEPGEVARREADGTYTVEPGKMNLWMLEKWAGEIAWLYAEGLAQRDASPETEPDPYVAAGADEPAGGYYPPTEQARTEPAERKATLDPFSPAPEALDRKWAEKFPPKPAEDRTKPAHGWEVGQRPSGHCMGRLVDDEWTSDAFLSRAAAVRGTWRKYDAEQARKAGESDE